MFARQTRKGIRYFKLFDVNGDGRRIFPFEAHQYYGIREETKLLRSLSFIFLIRFFYFPIEFRLEELSSVILIIGTFVLKKGRNE